MYIKCGIYNSGGSLTPLPPLAVIHLNGSSCLNLNVFSTLQDKTCCLVKRNLLNIRSHLRNTYNILMPMFFIQDYLQNKLNPGLRFD